MKQYLVQQGSDDWFALRIGRPTASEFKRIITGRQMKYSTASAGYIDQLIGEAGHHADGRYPVRAESYTSRSMDWGQENEIEARAWYDMQLPGKQKARLAGFCTTDDGRFGCSPDALVDPDGGCEIKCPFKPGIQMGRFRKGVVPLDCLAQVHGNLIVTGRKWWDFVSYCHGCPPLLVRVEPNEFTDKLREYLERFWSDYQRVLVSLKERVS